MKSYKGQGTAIKKLMVIALLSIALVILIAVAVQSSGSFVGYFNDTIDEAQSFWETSTLDIFGIGQPYPDVVYSHATQIWAFIHRPRSGVEQIYGKGIGAKGVTGTKATCNASELGLETINRDYPLTKIENGKLTPNSSVITDWNQLSVEEAFQMVTPENRSCLSLAVAAVSYPDFKDRYGTDNLKQIKKLIKLLDDYYDADCGTGREGWKCALRKYYQQHLQ